MIRATFEQRLNIFTALLIPFCSYFILKANRFTIICKGIDSERILALSRIRVLIEFTLVKGRIYAELYLIEFVGQSIGIFNQKLLNLYELAAAGIRNITFFHVEFPFLGQFNLFEILIKL